MPARNQRLVKIVGAAVLVSGLLYRGPAVLWLLSFLAPVFSGHVTLDLVGMEILLSLLVAVAILMLKVSLGVGLLRLQAGALRPTAAVAGFELIFIAFGLVRAMTSDVLGPSGIWVPILVAVVLVDIATISVLTTVTLAEGVTRSGMKAQGGHEARMRHFLRLRDGWKSVGNHPDLVIVNIAPANFVIAPFSWLLAGIFYLFVVLPLKPWGR